ncbi:hypothetical protein EIP86_005115 [Pleurotus ostreatoroseus]|nr:hypothetical protein EIP86_005115 [Pleurotus ostreatoroseus]
MRPLLLLFLVGLAGIAVADSYQRYEGTGHSQAPFNLPRNHKPGLTPKIKAYVEAIRQNNEIQGISIGVVHMNNIYTGLEINTEYGSWGIRTEDGDPTTPDTLFSIGSCSKAFLIAAMGILMEDFAQGKNLTALPDGLQKLAWDTKIQDLLPDEWELADHWTTEKADLRDILSHVSGLPRHDLSYKRTDSMLDVVKRMRLLKPTFELRQQWQYNNQMYVLAAHLITKYSGTEFTSFVDQRIFKPLGMNSSTYHIDEATRSGNMSQSFTADYRRIPHQFSFGTTEAMLAGAGGILSNARDMTKWIATFANNGVDPVSRKVVVPAATVIEATMAHCVTAGVGLDARTSFMGYGLGWMRYAYRGHEIVGHGGGLPGYVTWTTFLPRDGLGIIMFVNRISEVPLPVAHTIIETVLGLAELQPQEGDNYGIPFIGLSPSFHGIPPTFTMPAPQASADEFALPLSVYEGTYSNPAYGAFTLCSPSSTSHYCTQVLDTFSSVMSLNNATDLYAAWTTTWSTHLRFIHRTGNDFGVEITTIYPAGYGKNKTAFIDRELYDHLTFRATFDMGSETDGSPVQGLVFPGGFELPEVAIGYGSPWEKIGLYFNKV